MLPTTIPVAGPLFLHAHFELSASCELGFEGQAHATTGVGVSGDVRLSAHYKKDGFEKADGKKSRFAFEAAAPGFELAPKPYLDVQAKQQVVRGRCSLQPAAVVLFEKTVGAKLAVEPYVDLIAARPDARSRWTFEAEGGVSVSAATDVRIFGRRVGKQKEVTLYEVALFKHGAAVGLPPPATRPTTPLRIEDAPAEDPVADDESVASNEIAEGTPAAAAVTVPVAAPAKPSSLAWRLKKKAIATR